MSGLTPMGIRVAGLFLGAVCCTATYAETAIQRENLRPGSADWRLSHPAEAGEIEGYASLTSVNRGEQIKFFVNTEAETYRIDVYRMGWYGEAGARLIIGGVIRKGVRQEIPMPDSETGLIECRWIDPYVLTTVNPQDGRDWLSGIYLAKLTALPNGKQSYIIFVVREDDRRSDFLFQSSVTTYQAYNNWGGQSLYGFNSLGRPARKVSFSRPYAASENPTAAFANGAGDFLATNAIPPSDPSSPAGWEYNMVRWLEREGYDITYSTNVDTHADPALLTRHKAWLSVGHDEYWSWAMRSQVERARDHRVGLGFFSANVCYWQIRLEPSPLTGEPNRTIIAYKDEAVREDPFALDGDPANDHLITGRWREPPVNRPEESLVGVMYDGNPVDADLVITDATHWVVVGTGVQTGEHLPGLVGYEADRLFRHAPAGTEVIGHSPYEWEGTTHYADTTVYTWPSGATVFAAGTIQWSWALDDFNVPALRPSRLHPAAQQMTRNVLARLAGNSF
ncbi:MAG: N,N-dimethylformamidase beta subunit family domain-containing protein [Nitrospiraceae bacterium]